MESENNATLIDTLSLILAMFQLLICNLHCCTYKDCDIEVEILRTCLVKVCQTLSIGHAHNPKTIGLFTLADFKAIPFMLHRPKFWKMHATQKRLSMVCA